MTICGWKIVIARYGRWYRYFIPRRLTLPSHPAIYRWLFWNFRKKEAKHV